MSDTKLFSACMSAVLTVVAFGSSQLFGWTDTGHEMIASMAYDEMTPAARSALDELLQQHPRYEKDLLAGKPGDVEAGRYAFMIAATWPDLVRSQAHPMHYVANHPDWHYIEMPFRQPGYTPPAMQPVTTAPASQPAGPRNVLEALEKVSTDLRNPALPAQERAIALCWLVHLGGDLHQPLHAASRVSAKFPDGDHGGVMAMVLRTPGQVHSQIGLHLLWDSMLGAYRSPEMMIRAANGLRLDPQLSREKLAGQIALHDFATWAKESHELAMTDVYLNGKLETVNVGDLLSGRQTEIPAIPADYLAGAEEVAARRGVLAAYRIADLLNTALKPPAGK